MFQRRPQYSVPARNAPLAEDFLQYVREHHDEIREVVRSTPNGHPFRIAKRNAFDVSEAERQAIYEKAWEKGGLQFRASFYDMLLDKKANDTAAEFIKRKIREIVKDPKTAQALADIDHPYATKRPPIDTNYFETFNRDNVTLVDLRADPIERITPAGIKTRTKEHALDIIVFATGFDAMTGPLLKIDIRGRDGVALRESWAAGPMTYLGLQVPGFPNLFTVTGPGKPVGPLQHARGDRAARRMDYRLHRPYARKRHRTLRGDGRSGEKWGEHVNAAAHATLLPLATHSWYLGANIPGKPRMFMPYAGGMARYRAICDDVAARGYEGFVMGRAQRKATVNDFSAGAKIASPGV